MESSPRIKPHLPNIFVRKEPSYQSMMEKSSTIPGGLTETSAYANNGRVMTSPRFGQQVRRTDPFCQPLINSTGSGPGSLPGKPTENRGSGGSGPGEAIGMESVSNWGMGFQNSLMQRERDSMRSHNSSSRSSSRGSTISFHNINYVVNSKKMPWSKPEEKIVLNNVSGIIRPGLNAIMGPTGSGKSSLLDVLAGRKDPSFLEGIVLVDGFKQPRNFKCVSGYVVQDDIVMGTLTVRENLNFSAALRLPPSTTEGQRKEKVNQVIEELGLVNVAESKIGTDLFRGVSGGERKRTNIGMELITDPSVLFLDEPTTGLDAFTAGSVIKTLKNLANRGRTIIFSIHQPKYSIYKLFDTLTLVCRGQLVYHGASDQTVLRYFKRIGYHCEDHNNPPDFFMDILHGEVKMADSEPQHDVFDDNDSLNDLELTTSPETVSQVAERLINEWKISPENRKIQHDSDIYLQNLNNTDKNHNHQNGKNGSVHVDYATGFCNQLNWVCWRTALNLFRNPQASVVQIAVYLFFAVSVGLVYHKLDFTTESGIQNRTGLFFFACIQMVFVNLAAVDVFIKERVIFIHENSSGYYRVSAYFLAKIFCDMVPIKALPVILFMPITYFIAGLRPDAGAVFFYELNLVLTTVAACSIAFCISASFSVFGIANLIISLIYVFMMVFGGYLINIDSMGAWLSWCRYLSVFRYCISALAVNELKDLTFCSWNRTEEIPPGVNATVAPPREPKCILGTEYLSEQAIPYETGWDLWQTQLGLGIIILLFGTMCYVQLRRINKYK